MGNHRGKNLAGSICGCFLYCWLNAVGGLDRVARAGALDWLRSLRHEFWRACITTLGGIVYEHAGFYSVFIMGLCVVLVNLVLILLMIDRKTAANYVGQNDPTNYSPLRNGKSTKSAIANGKRRLPTVEDGDPTTTTPLLSQCRETCSVVEKDPSWWTIVGGFLGNQRISAALYGCLINTVLVSAMDAVLPIFIKQTFHWFSGATGAMFLNLTIPSLIGPAIGMISEKYGARLISGVGFTLAAVAVAGLALVQHDDTSSKVMACVLLSFVGKLRPEPHERQSHLQICSQ